MIKAIRLGIRQILYEDMAFWRNPVAAFFTFVFPLMFLFIINLTFGKNVIERPQGTLNLSDFYVPMIIAFSVINSSYTGLAMNLTISRDRGILKRIRGTPLPAFSFLFGKIAHNTLISALLVVIVTGIGSFLFDVSLPTKTALSFLTTLLIGAATFSCLGVAVTTLIPNADAAPAVVNASILPLLFVSDVFIPMDQAPSWLNMVANVFPVRSFSIALQDAFNPLVGSAGFNVTSIFIMSAWLLIGLFTAIKFFSWEPRK